MQRRDYRPHCRAQVHFGDSEGLKPAMPAHTYARIGRAAASVAAQVPEGGPVLQERGGAGHGRPARTLPGPHRQVLRRRLEVVAGRRWPASALESSASHPRAVNPLMKEGGKPRRLKRAQHYS